MAKKIDPELNPEAQPATAPELNPEVIREAEASPQPQPPQEQSEWRAVERIDGDTELALERAVVAEAGQRVEIGPDGDRGMGPGVLERDRGLGGEELRQLELVRREVGLLPLADPPDV